MIKQPNLSATLQAFSIFDSMYFSRSKMKVLTEGPSSALSSELENVLSVKEPQAHARSASRGGPGLQGGPEFSSPKVDPGRLRTKSLSFHQGASRGRRELQVHLLLLQEIPLPTGCLDELLKAAECPAAGHFQSRGRPSRRGDGWESADILCEATIWSWTRVYVTLCHSRNLDYHTDESTQMLASGAESQERYRNTPSSRIFIPGFRPTPATTPVYRCIQQLQRDSDQREGAIMMVAVLSKRKGGYAGKRKRADCYCVYIENEDIRDSILKKACTLNNCFAEMLLICSFTPASLTQPL
ncbi:uncharacterized protein LOC130540629 [Pan paniscus]|uniref:uncharacterized protein LOC130540629 n=1 Tax=Pan paniscus TaxID=9597 RepID=UPI0025464FA0|nr:uncharacterized protein LOC130540629 [Pan paniscus]